MAEGREHSYHQALDADGDGFLTFDEFKNTDHHFLRMTEDDADPSNYLENAGNAFKLADENNDKKLDAEEYICFQHPYLILSQGSHLFISHYYY